MLLDRFGRLLNPSQALMRKTAGGDLLRAASGDLAGNAACCCDTAGPTTCAGAAGVAGCFSDLYASYPNQPGDNAAMYAYLSGFQFDIDFSGTFGFPCSTATCDNIAAPFTVTHFGTVTWTYGENCTDGAVNYSWSASLTWFCGSPLAAGTCAWDIGVSVAKTSGSPLWSRGLLWRSSWTTQKVFATTNENIDFASQAATSGSPGCLYAGGAASLAVH